MIVPAECFHDPVEPDAVTAPVLPSLPASQTDPAYLPIRTQRAELAGLYYQGQRDSERDARLTNARPQQVCANWARRQEQ